ncbi:MAG: PQQ-binding-like beta-propeller repeat protein [Gammaproteobacteria bacterium]
MNALSRISDHHRWLLPILMACAGTLSGCAAPSEQAGTDLDDPDVKRQLQGASGGTDAHPGAAVYNTSCAGCHDSGMTKAPARNILQMLAPNAMLGALNDGIMRQQAAALSPQQRKDVVEFLVGKADDTPIEIARCDNNSDWFDLDQAPVATGWGQRLDNSRHINAANAGLSNADIAELEVKWVFDYPQSTRARSHPAIAGGALFVGSQSGTLYALDRRTGCAHWTADVGAEVRTGITIAPFADTGGTPVGFFGDILARTYAIDLISGAILWKTKVDDHPNATATAQPVYFEGKVYQSVSSLEVVPAADPNYPCCSFRGSIATLNARSGELLRKTYTIAEAPAEVGKNNVGVPILAPSGAPVWNTPALDTKLRRLYFGTGENYSSPAEGSSDAIIAMDLDSGDIAWVAQMTARDAWNVACMAFITNKTNCPEEEGPDLDFGAPPILVEHGGQRILVAGQKSGVAYGIDPRSGEVIWRRKVGRGGVQGGVHFGMAASAGVLFVPISDFSDEQWPVADAKPGLYALDAFTGEPRWSYRAPDTCGDLADCQPGISAAITSLDNAVLAGHMDGILRAYDHASGDVLWEFDAKQDFESVAGRRARGGSFGGGTGPVAHDGMLYFNSGYGLYFHMPGNALIAMGPKDQ